MSNKKGGLKILYKKGNAVAMSKEKLKNSLTF